PAADFGHASIDLFHLLSHPADAGNFNGSIRSNPESGGNVSKPVRIRYRILFRVIEQDRKSHAELLDKLCSVLLFILRDADDRYVFIGISFVNAFEIGECILANRTGDFEECNDRWALSQRTLQREGIPVHCWQCEVWGSSSDGESRQVRPPKM